jgi:hypothetical protein
VTEAGEADDAPYGNWRRWRWPLVAAVVLGIVLCVLSVPFRAETADFASDLAAGKIARVDLAPPQRGLGWPTVQITSSESQVRWQNNNGLTYQAPLYFPTGAHETDVEQTIAATARSAHQEVPMFTGSIGPLGSAWFAWQLWVVWLLCVVLLLLGPQPRRLTKWGTFWILGVGFGLGALWWLWREAPWNARASALPEPTPGKVAHSSTALSDAEVGRRSSSPSPSTRWSVPSPWGSRDRCSRIRRADTACIGRSWIPGGR